MAEAKPVDEADDINSLTAVMQQLTADYTRSGARLVVIEGSKLRPEVVAAATGHRGVRVTCVGVVRRAAVLSHGHMDDSGLRQLQQFAARAGAWLVATGQASDITGQGSADCLWWTLLHYRFADRDKKEVEDQIVWVHNPLLGSLEALAEIRAALAQAEQIAVTGDHQSETGTPEIGGTALETPARMFWQDAAERMDRLRQQGEPFTSQPKLADQFGCSSATINKAIRFTPSLKSWARVNATPKAQSINEVVANRTAQHRELGPEDEAAIREYLERDDITPDERAFFNGLSAEDQLVFLYDPEKGQRILGRKP